MSDPIQSPPLSPLELTPGDPLRFTFNSGRFAGLSFRARPLVCPDPQCVCTVLHLDCLPSEGVIPDSAGERPWRIELNIRTRTVSAAEGAAQAEREFADAVAGHIGDADWGRFHGVLCKIKRSLTENADLDSIDLNVPLSDVLEGVLVAYEHVLPWDEPIEFKLGADRWLGLDQYCLRPGCNCSEAGIELFRHSGMSSQQRSPLPQAAFLFVDYHTGRVKIARSARRCPPLKPVIAALREAFPDLADRLRERHLKLKRIARRALEASGTAVATPTPEPVPGPPVGRNDPCPCGSGKKFKKCCGST